MQPSKWGGESTEEEANQVEKPEEILDMVNSDQDSWVISPQEEGWVVRSGRSRGKSVPV